MRDSPAPSSPMFGMISVFIVLTMVMGFLFYSYGRDVEHAVQNQIVKEELERSRSQAREFASKVADALQKSKFGEVIQGKRAELLDFGALAENLLKQNRYVAYVHIQNDRGETLMFKGPEVIQKVVFRDDSVTFMERTTESMRFITLDEQDGIEEGGIHDLTTLLKSDANDGVSLGKLRVGFSKSRLDQYSAKATERRRYRLIHYLLAATLIMVAAFSIVRYHFGRVRQLEQDLAYQSRMAYVGSLASGLVHELRNPINAMNLNLSLLEEEVDDLAGSEAKSLRRLLARISPGLAHLEKVSAEFLEFARPPEVTIEPVAVNEVLQDVVNLVRSQCDGGGIEVQCLCDEGLQPVESDPVRLHQIVLNLVVNAIQAMPDGGTLTLRCAHRDDKLVVTITDTGVGIAAEEKDKLFKLFYTTKEGGVGLGLPIVKRLVLDLDGTIDVTTGVDEGTTFTIHFPLLEHHG